MCCLLCGCAKTEAGDIVNKYEDILDDTSAYKLDANMDIVSNEELYHYDVVVDYMKDEYYKVTLTNTDNNHTQIILKNDNGVYVVTHKSTKYKLRGEYL